MKIVIHFVLLDLALCLAAVVDAAPSPAVESMQVFNTSIPLTSIYNDTISTLGYDPSNSWQKWATVEVWTGGSQRKPVNVGNVIGHDLHMQVARLLDIACPSKNSPWGMYCDNYNWQGFQTHYLERPPAGIKQDATFIKVNAGQWATEEIRRIMMNIIGRVLFAYTNQPLGTNCYEVPGQGKYCNVPQFVRVNLPDTSPAHPGWGNFWHVELWGGPDKFSKHGNLKPCGTRAAVDAELDRYRGDLEAEFQEWKGNFKRDTRVIINGYKVCTNEA